MQRRIHQLLAERDKTSARYVNDYIRCAYSTARSTSLASGWKEITSLILKANFPEQKFSEMYKTFPLQEN